MIERACCALYIGLLPVMIIPDLPVVGHKLQLADGVFACWLLACCAGGNLRGLLRVSHPVTAALLLLLSVAVVTTLTAKHILIGSVELLGIVYLVALYHLLLRVITTWQDWRRVICLWVWVSTGVAVAGIAGVGLGYLGVATPLATRMDGFYHILAHPFWVGTSTFLASPTPNMVYGYLHVGMFLSLGLLVSASGSDRMAYAAAVGLHLLGIALSYSRGWVSGMFGLLVFVWPFRTTVARVFSHALFAAWLVVAGGIGVLSEWSIRDVIVTQRPVSPAPSAEEHDRYYPYLQQDVPIRQLRVEAIVAPFMRPFLRQAAVQMWKERPLLGVGPGNFSYELFRRRATGEQAWWGLEVREPWDPHSTYLGMLAEMGIGGALALLALLGAAVWQIAQAVKTAGPPHRRLVWALLSCVCGYLILAWDDDLLTKRWLWVVLALGGSAYQLSRPSHHPATPMS